jgi:uncharacterized protein (DUF1778 family)
MTARKKKSDKADTTTVSTRFDDKQKELLEEAAKAADCTVAKFVRDAALQKAVAVVNASGPSEVRLRQLAEKLVNHIYAATAESISDIEDGDVIAGYVVRSELYTSGWVKGPDGSRLVSHVNRNLANEIKEATRTCGPEFARFFKEALFAENRDCVAYKPELNPEDYL